MTTVSTCRICHRQFFYAGPEKGGRKRVMCDECLPKHKRDATRQRVRKHRQDVKKAQADKPILIVHIRSCNGKTYCGRKFSTREAQTIAEMRHAGKIDTIMCKACHKAFMADDGSAKL